MRHITKQELTEIENNAECIADHSSVVTYDLELGSYVRHDIVAYDGIIVMTHADTHCESGVDSVFESPNDSEIDSAIVFDSVEELKEHVGNLATSWL